MPALPEEVSHAWDNREGPVVLTTVDNEGVPNSIYASCVSMYGNDTIVVANNYFSKTMKNIAGGGKGSALFLTKEGKPYQIKGRIEYHQSGPIFEDMKTWNPDKHPGHGAAALKAEEVYSGATQLM